jgi:hypothetical protein
VKPNEANLRRLVNLADGVRARLDDPALLRALGAEHRKQEAAIFRTEGAAGGAGPWARLNPRYAVRKAKAVGARKKILDLTGETKAAFTRPGPNYIQQFIPRGNLGIFQFGARSAIAAAHRTGNPALSPQQSGTAKKAFGGRAPRLPVRDMVAKSGAQLEELRRVLLQWYLGKVRQFLRAGAALAGR